MARRSSARQPGPHEQKPRRQPWAARGRGGALACGATAVVGAAKRGSRRRRGTDREVRCGGGARRAGGRALARSSGCACCPRTAHSGSCSSAKPSLSDAPWKPPALGPGPQPPRSPVPLRLGTSRSRSPSLGLDTRRVGAPGLHMEEKSSWLQRRGTVLAERRHALRAQLAPVTHKVSRHLTPQFLAPLATRGKRHRLEFTPNRVPTASGGPGCPRPSGR